MMHITKLFSFLFMLFLLFSCAGEAARREERTAAVYASFPHLAPQSNQQQSVQQITPTTDNFADVLNNAIDNALNEIKKKSIIALADIVAPNQTVYNFLTFELEHSLVSKSFSVVDRSEIDRIRAEWEFQLSGEVDDHTAVSIGKISGADVIVIARAETEGNNNRLRLRLLDTQTALVIGTASELFTTSLSMRPGPITRPNISTTQKSTPSPQPPTTISPTSSPPPTTTPSPIENQSKPAQNLIPRPPIEEQKPQTPLSGWENWIKTNASGVSPAMILSSGSLSGKFTHLQRTVESHGVYVLEVNENERISSPSFSYSGAINVYIVLVGVGENRVISLQSNGRMFTIPSNVTFILDNNITLQGHSGNTASLIDIYFGRLVMLNGATITGNHTNVNGGGVHISYGTFDMIGGSITNNRGKDGGGIYVGNTFNFLGGIISNNSAINGGGVYHANTTSPFNMRGGMITDNIASRYGGGVYLWFGGGSSVAKFNKTGGTITGSDNPNGNRVQDEDGSIARRGHAVWIAPNARKEVTSGPNNNLNSETGAGWEK